MAIDSGIAGALGAAGAGLSMILLLRLARKNPAVDPQTGEFVLVYSNVLRTASALVATVVPLAVGVLAIFKPPKDVVEVWCIVALIAYFAIHGAVLWVESTRVKIHIGPQGIRGRSPWRRGERSIAWTDVQRVTYSKVNVWFVIHGQNGIKIRISLYVTGIRSLVQAFRDHLPAQKYEAAAKGILVVETGHR